MNNLDQARTAPTNQEVQGDIQKELIDVNEDLATRFDCEVAQPTLAAIVKALKESHSQEEATQNVIGAIPVGRKYEDLRVHFTPSGVDEDGDGLAAEVEASVALENDEGEYVLISTDKIRL